MEQCRKDFCHTNDICLWIFHKYLIGNLIHCKHIVNFFFIVNIFERINSHFNFRKITLVQYGEGFGEEQNYKQED